MKDPLAKYRKKAPAKKLHPLLQPAADSAASVRGATCQAPKATDLHPMSRGVELPGSGAVKSAVPAVVTIPVSSLPPSTSACNEPGVRAGEPASKSPPMSDYEIEQFAKRNPFIVDFMIGEVLV
jgi:hypothetical protein